VIAERIVIAKKWQHNQQVRGEIMRIKVLSEGIKLVLACAAFAFGADLYISPTGNDAAAGTITAPLATLAAARDKADQLKGGNTPVTVYLRGGTYYLAAPLVFGAANSGTETAPIIYTAYGIEKPVISGGIKITSAWAASSGSIMVTTIAQNLKVDQLFLNGKRQILARYPNFDTTKDNNNTRRLDGYAADCIGATHVGKWANPAEGPGYIRGLHEAEWGGNDYKMTGKNGTTLTYTWVGDNNRGSAMHATYRMVENLFEELDAAGEWFYRKSTGQLFFWPPAGTNLSTATIELASQDELLRFVGSTATSANSVKFIKFAGITFTHTFRTLFSKPYEPVLKSDWAIARAGTVFMQNAENIQIKNCFFDQIGGNGVFMSGYNRNHLIFNNVFIDAGATAVALVGLTSSVRCPSSWSNTPACNDKAKGPLTPEYPSFITVDNNMINHSGRFEKQSAGIDISMSEYDTIRHNTVHDVPRAGINFTDGCWGGHIIENNWVYASVLETGDHGPFNAWGRDRNDRWTSDTTATTMDGRSTTVIRNNRFEVRQGCFGIDLDDGASNYLQYNNLLFGGGLKLQGNRYNTYLNNILVGSCVEIHGVWWGSQDIVARNIYFNHNFQIYYIGFFPTGSAVPDSVKNHVKMIDSNCIWDDAITPKIWSQNGNYTWAQWHTAGLDVHSALADPMFTDTAKVFRSAYLPRGDYRVKPGSPALTMGFKNFPMDSFGVIPVVMCTGAGCGDHIIKRIHAMDGLEKARCIVNYRAGRLIVSHDGEYQLTITTALGRTVKVFRGRGNSCLAINPEMVGSGVYIVSVRATGGVVTRKFIVE
jgi:hypothetical protein